MEIVQRMIQPGNEMHPYFLTVDFMKELVTSAAVKPDRYVGMSESLHILRDASDTASLHPAGNCKRVCHFMRAVSAHYPDTGKHVFPDPTAFFHHDK